MESLYDVLIVDDDYTQAHFVEEILSALGFTSKIVLDGRRALEEARAAKPRLTIIDIIMPGIDGLSVCRSLRPEADAWGGKLLVASAKDGSVEEPRALRSGASGFLEKPYSLSKLREAVGRLLGAAPKGRVAVKAGVRVTVWGSRGAGKAGTSAFGTRTPCVSVGLPAGDLLILDAGTGIRDCAGALAPTRKLPPITVLLTHYHETHVEGLKGLALLARPDASLRVGGPRDPDVAIKDLLMDAGARDAVATFFVDEAVYRISEALTVRAIFTNHPTTTVAFGIEAAGRKIIYCPDSELSDGDEEVDFGNNFERLRAFALGADLLLHDAHCAPEDAVKRPGHSSWQGAVRLAVQAEVRRLLLFHAAMEYPDDRLAALESAARERAAEEMTSLRCSMARDALTIDF
ncbi:MAG: response regulator [Elusimicrobia bacterium]|nr:response regulator [Elusimicrobiota bacterium]